ncbi:diguanylate cyclase (GGDEF) domain-containing protein [Devosia sp. YR412]|uniref:GGDEF domain-containing protein n=1 Tax=Devosia sp. YR412 TaxID=1881030 RepID=UPI0008CDD995|nr:GGDEF domain-containing protein [Devosia sp. YR412]SEP96429.1 diguanylate cyclase (GGDEF) domain-containing protein [Devosia sp. YR412]
MSGQFFFTLLNPAVAAILAVTFLVLWRKRSDQLYLAMLALAFGCSGVAFAINDLLPYFETPASRIAANLMFLVAIASACIGGLLRVGQPVPWRLFAGTSAICAVLFSWYLFVAPSTEARIYVVSAAYVILTSKTVWMLFRATPRGLDWLFVGLSSALLLLAILRPAATLLKQLDINSAGSFRDSAYWATVQAVTPVIAIAMGLAFLFALASRLFDELTAEANRDFLTGLLNRRGFDKGVQKLLGGAPDAAVMIVDIDNFKLVNDTYGHGTGDQVIAAVARVLTKQGEADLVARTGGEEFTLFYRAIQRPTLLEHAEAIRHEMTQTEFPGLPYDRYVTVSMGLHPRIKSESISEMMSAADRALYDAKRAGKDRAVLGAPPLQARAFIHERRVGSRARAV